MAETATKINRFTNLKSLVVNPAFLLIAWATLANPNFRS